MSERPTYPMNTARLVRDGRPVELQLPAAATLGWEKHRVYCEAARAYFVVGSWSHQERGWFVAQRDARDITGGSGPYIDDDFEGWRNLAPVIPPGFSA